MKSSDLRAASCELRAGGFSASDIQVAAEWTHKKLGLSSQSL